MSSWKDASVVSSAAEGLYWLGIIPQECSCEVPSCTCPGVGHAAFLLRGHTMAIGVCKFHRQFVERWVAKPKPFVVTELVKALRRPSMVRELSPPALSGRARAALA